MSSTRSSYVESTYSSSEGMDRKESKKIAKQRLIPLGSQSSSTQFNPSKKQSSKYAWKYNSFDKNITYYEGYVVTVHKLLFYWILSFLSVGIALLFSKWSLRLHIKLRYSRSNLRDCTHVLVVRKDGSIELVAVDSCILPFGSNAEEIEFDILSNVAPDIASSVAPYRGLYSSPPVSDLNAPSSQAAVTNRRPLRLLSYRCLRYVYCAAVDTFIPVPVVLRVVQNQLSLAADRTSDGASRQRRHGGGGGGAMLQSLVDYMERDGQQPWSVEVRRIVYGPNALPVPVRSLAALIVDEMWHPFYVFQYFSVLLWMIFEAYYSYSICILVVTWFSIISGALETFRNRQRLAEIASNKGEVEVLRKPSPPLTFASSNALMTHDQNPYNPSTAANPSVWTWIPSSDLVPGDLVRIRTGVVPADIALIRGETIVDENMLTGESIPVRKVVYSPSSATKGSTASNKNGKDNKNSSSIAIPNSNSDHGYSLSNNERSGHDILNPSLAVDDVSSNGKLDPDHGLSTTESGVHAKGIHDVDHDAPEGGSKENATYDTNGHSANRQISHQMSHSPPHGTTSNHYVRRNVSSFSNASASAFSPFPPPPLTSPYSSSSSSSPSCSSSAAPSYNSLYCPEKES
eukprot:CAMPEP_0175055658 /NCGR_PEP_ID=MMETSP0052_2-20121109/10211_1 /TAXON_ID=51329 ORGANISM="Polytomella parva, Strain SAG 63-3" /NCGR_SAMPLE_ID=MMETSP0052_2 /ASSEMBLY_ACC=CAM_ASM_000194 /LENGTH=628 /DNA_ID=CAMNT_0016320545 /DNA_START=102 /DNA_END=1984 /DNA_ORIENTATION=+